MEKSKGFDEETDVGRWRTSGQARLRRRRITTVAAVIAAALFVGWVTAHREVFATGKTTGQWLRQLREGDHGRRQEAGEALVSIGPRAAPGLAAALGDPDVLVRRAAVRAGEPILTECERNLDIRGNFPILFIPGRNATEAGFPVLLDAMVGRLTDEDAEVRRTAARLVLKYGTPRQHRGRAVTVLREALHDRDPAVRRALCDALCRPVGDGNPPDGADAVPVLAYALIDRDATVRLAAVGALVRSQKLAATAPLIGVLEDKAEAVRQAAREGVMDLIRLAGSGYMPDPKTLGDVGAAVRGALPFFIGRLERFEPEHWTHQQEEERVQAIAAIGVAGGPEVVAPLVEAVTYQTLRDPNASWAFNANNKAVRWAAASALDEVSKDPKALTVLKAHVPALTAALDDPAPGDWRAEVAAVLGRVGPDAAVAVPKLIPLLRLPDPGGRQKVVEALGSIAPSSEEVRRALRRVEAEDQFPKVRDAAHRFTTLRKP